jgi:hypothetical protein
MKDNLRADSANNSADDCKVATIPLPPVESSGIRRGGGAGDGVNFISFLTEASAEVGTNKSACTCH